MNIRELAAIAGVSKTTVAYALKNSPRVHPDTRQRIQGLAREHGYNVNPAVKSFMREVRQGRIGRGHHTLAFVSSLDPDGQPRRHRHRNESELIQGARAEAEARGCDLDIIDWSLDVANQVRLSQIVDARGIQGLFLGPATAPHMKMNLPWDRIAVLSSGYTVEEPPMDRTACDLFSSVVSAGERALARGYHPVVIAMNDYSNERVGWRWLSAATTLRELHGDRIHILRGTVATMVPRIQAMRAANPFMAVLGHFDLYGELIALGLRFPRDLAFVAFDRLPESPTVTAIVQPHFESGRRGLRYLLNAVENGVFGIPENPCRLSVQCQWHEGETLPNRAK